MVERNADGVPKIFYLLTGYFRSNRERFESVGIFRVTSSDLKVRTLETHMALENYAYLETVKSPDVVASYMKRILREMKEPLIPFEFYNEFSQIKHIEEDEKFVFIKQVIEKMPLINKRTLKFLASFFQ